MRSSPDGAQAPERGAAGVLDGCERLLAAHDALRLCVSIEPRRREDQDADLRLLFADREWLRSPAGERLMDALRTQPSLASVQRHKAALLLRFDDAALAELERRLAAGELAGMVTCDLLVGRRFTVGFVGPNTNKALHVGHLRNIVLGQALSAAMAAAGSTVQRHNLVGDIGRRVCEAMGGYATSHAGEDPQSLGIAGDRFVELCCRNFPRPGNTADASVAAGDPNAEEREPQGDLADAIMQAWLAGADAERALWRRMREWALAGHERTLGRLGVSMDRQDFESDGIPRALELIEDGLAAGLFEREPGGGVVYRTGRPEYATMVLLRSDGAPTEYARLLGVYHRMDEALHPDALYIEVVGIEWQPVMAVQADLLTKLLRRPSDARYTWALHGSLTVGGEKMGSSTGEVLWIDDLLDELAACAGVAALHELAGGAVGHAELADMIVRGTFLCSATQQPLAFERGRLIAGRSGPGWTIAQAWCRARRSQQHAPASSPLARTGVVQSQLYRGALERAVQRHDTANLAAYLHSLAEAFLATPVPGPAAEPVLRSVLESLGFNVKTRSERQHRAIALTGRGNAHKLSPDSLAPVAQVVKDSHKAVARIEC